MKIPTLETERLILRPYQLDDFDPLVTFYASDRAQYVGGPLSRDNVWRAFVGDVGQWHILGFGPLMIVEKTSGEPIGGVGINFPENYPEREIGWILYDGFEGKGLAMEAALCARDHAFNVLGWETLVSYIDPRNAPSITLAERMGAVLDRSAQTPNNDPCLVYRHTATPESFTA